METLLLLLRTSYSSFALFCLLALAEGLDGPIVLALTQLSISSGSKRLLSLFEPLFEASQRFCSFHSCVYFRSASFLRVLMMCRIVQKLCVMCNLLCYVDKARGQSGPIVILV